MKPGFIIIVIIGILIAWALLNTAGESISSLSERRENSDSASSDELITDFLSDDDRYSSRNTEEELEAGYSSFFNTITLDSAGATEERPTDEYLEIHADEENKTSINITGWTLKSTKSGHKITIGTVTKLPVYPGHNSQNNNVVLEPGDTAYIVSGPSPVRMSFRTNICTGYFAENKTFSPGLDENCPSPENENLERFGLDNDPPENSRDEECLSAIESVGNCRRSGEIDDELSRTCGEYLDKLDYSFCTRWHVGDEDFAGDEWYVYIGSKFNDIWNDESDIIELRDVQKLLVDVVDY